MEYWDGPGSPALPFRRAAAAQDGSTRVIAAYLLILGAYYFGHGFTYDRIFLSQPVQYMETASVSFLCRAAGRPRQTGGLACACACVRACVRAASVRVLTPEVHHVTDEN